MEQILNKINKFLVNSQGEGKEFEVRFGKFKANKFTENAKFFESNAEIDYFYRLKNFLDSNSNFFTKTVINTVETSVQNYSEKRSSFKRIINIDDGKETFMKKTNIENEDMEDFDIRFSLSSETMLTSPPKVNWEESKFTRTKNRFSYAHLDIGKIDLTIVKESSKGDFNKYEIEFEVNSIESSLIQERVAKVFEIIVLLLNICQNNFYVMSNSEKGNILRDYERLLRTNRFIGAQPETLQKDHLTMLYKELYSVTDKADGDRFLMFIDEHSRVFFIDNNLNGILNTDIICQGFRNCLVDGELIREFNETKHMIKMSFYAFDVMVINGNDIRGNTNFLLRERLNNLRAIVESVTQSERYTVIMKKFIYRNVFMGSEIIMNDISNKPYQNDGLIFTPMNEPYPVHKKWSKLLKWKPAELNTIDFYSVKKMDGSWELYVQEPGKKDFKTGRQERSTKVLFNVSTLCPDLGDQKELTFKTSFSDSLIDPTTNEAYKTNTVIEYSWNGSQFVPLRTRWDKTANPSKHGNFVHVACDIWKNINNPIEQTTLFKMRNDTTPQIEGKSFFFETITHLNKIKTNLIKKYKTTTNTQTNTQTNIQTNAKSSTQTNTTKTQNTNSILEICPSKNNLQSYSDFDGILHSLEWESQNSKHNIREACKNVKMNCKRLQSYHFMEIPFESNLIQARQDQLYQMIISTNPCEFFKSTDRLNKLVDFLNYKLIDNGKFIVSFIDSIPEEKIGYSDTNRNSGEIMYIIDSNKIFINGVTDENEIDSCIISSDYLIDYMKTKGYTVLETNRLPSHNLKGYEKIVAESMCYCVFVKSSDSDILPLPRNVREATRNATDDETKENAVETKENAVETKENDVTDDATHGSATLVTVNSQKKFISLHPVISLSNVMDVLNCISFKGSISKERDILLTTENFEKVSNYLSSQYQIETILFKDGQQIPKSNHSLVFYATIEETSEADETIPKENFYIMLYKKKIFYPTEELSDQQPTPQVQEQTTSEQGVQEQQPLQAQTNSQVQEQERGASAPKESVKESLKETIKQKLKTTKLTIVVLKEFLRELDLKVSGNKSELESRLMEAVSG